MSLDGLRAWIGEVERKLGMRTRVFLVLTVIAIGGAGAAIYLAIDARDSSVSESDVQALQERLETQIDAAATSASTPPAEPAESEPEPQSQPKPKPGKDNTTGGIGAGEGPSGAKLQELLEQAKAENEQAEKEQAGK